MSLPTVLWGPDPVSVRRFETLLRHLPVESATVRAAAPEAQWGPLEELTAINAELVDYGNRILHAAYSKEGARQPDPVSIPRPWQPKQAEKPKMSSPAEVKAFFTRSGGGG